MKSDKVSDMWKVPFRQVYCETLKDCIKQTFWCLVVNKVFPNAFDFAGAGFLEESIKDPTFFHDQYGFLLHDALRTRNGLPRRTSPFSRS